MSILTDDEIAERVARAAAEGEVDTDMSEPITPPPTADPSSHRPYRWVRPFTDAADGLIEVFTNEQGRYLFGLREIDLMTRGIGPGELCYISGFSHQGKSQVLLHSFLHNCDRNIVLCTLDETAELVLVKLIGMLHGVNAESLERRVKDRDPKAIEMVRRTARTDFKHLVVIDRTLDLGGMDYAVKEAEDYFGGPVGALAIDFLDLLPSGDTVDKKSQEIKRFTKDHDFPVICVHQNSRGHGGPGLPVSMVSMKYGGEAEANVIIGVRRKRDDDSLDSWEREKHQDTVSVSVVKNKRPPAHRGETDYVLDAETGALRLLSLTPPVWAPPAPTPQADAARAAIEARSLRLPEGQAAVRL